MRAAARYALGRCARVLAAGAVACALVLAVLTLRPEGAAGGPPPASEMPR